MDTHNPVLDDYRRTLKLLHRLKKRKIRERASRRYIQLLNQEIDEVSDVIVHLERKSDARWKW